MSPSTWPALIVGVFTVLNPSTTVAPSTDTPASNVTRTTAQPLWHLDTSTGTTYLAASATGSDGKPHTLTIPPALQEAAVTTWSPNLRDAMGHMPNVWEDGDPNKMDQMCIWDGTDPNKKDAMAFGYDPASVKFYNGAGSVDASTPKAVDEYLKMVPAVPPPSVLPTPLTPKAKGQGMTVPPPSITFIPAANRPENVVQP